MKLHFPILALLLIVLVAVASVNCVQKNPIFSAVTPTPILTPTPTPAYVSPHQFSTDEAYAIGNKAIDNPYVRKRLISVGWRDISNVPVKVGDVLYMTVHEKAPGYDVTRSLPAAVIVVGNESQAGINVIAYLDGNRVAYVGFVPRAGVNATGATYYSFERGVAEHVPGSQAERLYENVTVLDTGYAQGQNLSSEEDMVVRSIAIGNETVKKYVQGHAYVVRNVTINGIERGYSDRYIEAYPDVNIDIMDGGSLVDTLEILVDGRNGQVIAIAHKLPYEY